MIFSSVPARTGDTAVLKASAKLFLEGKITEYPPFNPKAKVADETGVLNTDKENAAGKIIFSSIKLLLIVNSRSISPRKDTNTIFVFLSTFVFSSRLWIT